MPTDDGPSGWTMARAERQLGQRRESKTREGGPEPQLGAFAGVLIDGDLLPEGEILGGEAEPGCQEGLEEKENRLDEAQGRLPGVCTSPILPGSAWRNVRNSQWWNENGIIARHSRPK